MERVSRFVEDCDGTPSRNQVMEGVIGNTKGKTDAINRLVASGHLRQEKGPRNAKLLAHVNVFRAADLDGNPA